MVYGTNGNGAYESVRSLEPEPFTVVPDEMIPLLQRRTRTRQTACTQAETTPAPETVSTSATSTTTMSEADMEHAEVLLRQARTRLDRGAPRNETGFWLACQCRDMGFDSTAAQTTLLTFQQAVAGDLDASGHDAAYTVAEALATVASAYTGDARSPGLPDGVVVDADRQEAELLAEVVSRLSASNRDHPRLFEQGGALVRIRTDEVGRDRIETLTPDACRNELANRIDFYKKADKGDAEDPDARYRAAAVPPHLARQVLVSHRGKKFPALRGMITSPTILSDGALITTNGYDPHSKLWLALGGLPSIVVPEQPTTEEITAARDLLLGDLLAEFPFTDPASEANAFAYRSPASRRMRSTAGHRSRSSTRARPGPARPSSPRSATRWAAATSPRSLPLTGRTNSARPSPH
jgi:hypothetical protein